MASTIYGNSLDTAKRPDLIRYCHEELGHKLGWLQTACGIAELKRIISNDIRYENGQQSAPQKRQEQDNSAIQTAAPDLLESLVDRKLPPLVDKGLATGLKTLEKSLKSRFDEALENRPKPVTLTVKGDTTVTVDLGLCHYLTPELTEMIILGKPTWVSGPAGAGKTHALMAAAKTISAIKGRDIKVYVVPGHRDLTADHILGYRNIVDGSVIRTPAREAFEHGGILLIDEIDRCPGVLTAINMMIENGHCGFPDGLIAKHEDFICVASANTAGQGATQHYVAAEMIDAATLNRFGFLEWPYDEKLERALAGDHASKWVARVQSLRKALISLGHAAPNLVISPRASYRGAEHLAKFPDTPFEKLERLYIWQGCNDDDRAKVLKVCK